MITHGSALAHSEKPRGNFRTATVVRTVSATAAKRRVSRP